MRRGDLSTPLLVTKLYIPPVRPEWVPRPRLLNVHSRMEAVERARELGLLD